MNTNKKLKLKLLKSQSELSVLHALIFILLFGLVGGITVWRSLAASHHQPVASAPLSFNQNWTNDPWHNISQYGCFGVDNQASWNGSGTLDPGATYTFNPSYPTCYHSELPVIAMHLSWSGATTLKLEATNPFVTANVGSLADVGKHIIAPISADAGSKSQANLCMIVDSTETDDMQNLTTHPPVNWSMTITNTGSQAATVTGYGLQDNGWNDFFYPSCYRADADADHWNDGLEMSLERFSYYTPNYPDPATFYSAFVGTDYLASTGTSTANDEIDFSPADFNDDGVINQTDASKVTAFIGQGTGVPIDNISPNPGDANYIYNQTGQWRRYDLDGDGYVTQHDLDMVQKLIGSPIPLTSDLLDPWADIRSPATVPAKIQYRLYSFASDNDILTHVDFYSGSSDRQKLLCQSWGTEASGHFCTWTTPKSHGTPTLITVIAYDNAGHSYTTSKTITTQ